MIRRQILSSLLPTSKASKPPAVQTPPPPLPLLITGLAGVPGFNAWHYFRALYPGQVIGIRQEDNRRIHGPDVVPCNAENP
ncbi:MAG: hypothetical protein ACWGMZ_05220, partial [Thermoguttaceae bacterium]